MNPRNTAILGLVVAALAAFVYLYEIKGGEARGQQTAAAKHLFRDVKPEDVSLVLVHTKDGKDARLERVDGAWKLLAPVSFPADGAAVDSMVSTLATLSSEAVVEDPAGPAEYGLDAPPKIRFQAGQKDYVLRLGIHSPVGSSTYAATAEDKPVYTVPTFQATTLDKGLDELRDKRPLRFDREAVAELRVRWPGGAVRLVRDEQDPEVWRLVEPLQTGADGQAVAKALSDLEFLRAQGFDDAPAPEVKKSLEQPALSVELVSRADGKESSARYVMGGPDKEGVLPAKGNVSDTVYRIPASAFAQFPKTVDGWRDKQIARFDPAEARRFELAFHDAAAAESAVLIGRRDGDAWKTEPDTLKPDAADTLVRALAKLEGAQVAAESMGAKELAAVGLSPPHVLARVFGADPEGKETTLAEVELGGVDKQRGIAARRAGRDTVYWLAADRASEIPTSLAALKASFVAPPGPPPPAAAPGEGEGPLALPPGHPGVSPPPAAEEPERPAAE